MARRQLKWRLITINGRVYAKYGHYTFKCCDRKIAPSDWIYVKDINMSVCSRCTQVRQGVGYITTMPYCEGDTTETERSEEHGRVLVVRY